eukprot:8685695-Pyramimonas_sp.AAC.1
MLVPPPDVENRFNMAKRARQKALTASAAIAAGNPAEKPKPPCLPGGQLIVCPTSVLRQWARELRDKVSPTSALSVLVHHGPDRTKNPYELIKYDVVRSLLVFRRTPSRVNTQAARTNIVPCRESFVIGPS